LSELRSLGSAAPAEPMDLVIGRINMKRTELLAIGIGVLASAGLFAVERAWTFGLVRLTRLGHDVPWTKA
jgi:hypothetical protein